MMSPKKPLAMRVEADAAEEIDATPTAVKLADEEDIDLALIEGTGDSGRILKSDVEDFIKAQPEAAGDESEADSAEGEAQD